MPAPDLFSDINVACTGALDFEGVEILDMRRMKVKNTQHLSELPVWTPSDPQSPTLALHACTCSCIANSLSPYLVCFACVTGAIHAEGTRHARPSQLKHLLTALAVVEAKWQ